ncbi:hypothetical protein RIF29_30039 [Crotalaria pallida]|uniref:Uncharacterized protein n=1 Tax=Crotalaria pallida TaxID=3830 RepID=A0AAN9HXZ4_CROPI
MALMYVNMNSRFYLYNMSDEGSVCVYSESASWEAVFIDACLGCMGLQIIFGKSSISVDNMSHILNHLTEIQEKRVSQVPPTLPKSPNAWSKESKPSPSKNKTNTSSNVPRRPYEEEASNKAKLALQYNCELETPSSIMALSGPVLGVQEPAAKIPCINPVSATNEVPRDEIKVTEHEKREFELQEKFDLAYISMSKALIKVAKHEAIITSNKARLDLSEKEKEIPEKARKDMHERLD